MSHTATWESGQRWQLLWITLGALALYVGLRWLPTGTNLGHMDFRVDPKSGTAIEFCDPSNPQFIPVVAVRSPVVLSVATAESPVAAQPIKATVTLRTSSGKPVAPADLLVVHTRPLHLLIIDPSLNDYQHVHPEPSGKPGEWMFAFTPSAGGTYRIFADFTPAATGRGLYASADLEVSGAPGTMGAFNSTAPLGLEQVRGDLRFSLTPGQQPVRANQPIDLKFAVRQDSGSNVALEPLMDAFAHMVAFDETRSGFAHLHPMEDGTQVPDLKQPVLNFKFTIPSPGRYVIWAQVKVAGEEIAVPFEVAVVP